IGNPDEKSMLELAHAVIVATGSKSELKFEPLPKDDPKQRCPDITKARAWRGWEPRVSLSVGLGKTVEYYRKLLASK
ncbi:MAG TPA: SDR family NAD-dependent epimerase/dehydratase, partial [Planctomycetaceae bacterium]|nr:SDR family NAD-dependent epimerase/dehydratase [Planctomycetaceae bacterium]